MASIFIFCNCEKDRSINKGKGAQFLSRKNEFVEVKIYAL
jgi:hypothetical protein